MPSVPLMPPVRTRDIAGDAGHLRIVISFDDDLVGTGHAEVVLTLPISSACAAAAASREAGGQHAGNGAHRVSLRPPGRP